MKSVPEKEHQKHQPACKGFRFQPKPMSWVICKILQLFIRCWNELVIWAWHELCNTPAAQNCFQIQVLLLAYRKLQVNYSRSKKMSRRGGIWTLFSKNFWDINSWTELPFWKKLQLFFGWMYFLCSQFTPSIPQIHFLPVLLCSFFAPKPKQQIKK